MQYLYVTEEKSNCNEHINYDEHNFIGVVGFIGKVINGLYETTYYQDTQATRIFGFIDKNLEKCGFGNNSHLDRILIMFDDITLNVINSLNYHLLFCSEINKFDTYDNENYIKNKLESGINEVIIANNNNEYKELLYNSDENWIYENTIYSEDKKDPFVLYMFFTDKKQFIKAKILTEISYSLILKDE